MKKYLYTVEDLEILVDYTTKKYMVLKSPRSSDHYKDINKWLDIVHWLYWEEENKVDKILHRWVKTPYRDYSDYVKIILNAI